MDAMFSPLVWSAVLSLPSESHSKASLSVTPRNIYDRIDASKVMAADPFLRGARRPAVHDGRNITAIEADIAQFAVTHFAQVPPRIGRQPAGFEPRIELPAARATLRATARRTTANPCNTAAWDGGWHT
jgi:hypothetical protein